MKENRENTNCVRPPVGRARGLILKRPLKTLALIGYEGVKQVKSWSRPLAGFEVTTDGRIWGDRRGYSSVSMNCRANADLVSC